MTTILAERSVPSCPEFQSLVRTRAERFSVLFGASPDAVVVRREAAGGNVLCALDFCEERNHRPLAVWRDETAIERVDDEVGRREYRRTAGPSDGRRRLSIQGTDANIEQALLRGQ